MSVQKDVDNYEDQINKLAKAVAFSVNIVHSGESDAAKDNMPFFVNKDKFKLNPDGTIESLGEDEIDASNIGVNSAILDNVMNIKAGAGDNPGENDGKRALAIAKLRNTLFKIQNINLSQIDRERFIEDLTGGLVENKDLGVYTLESNLNGMTIDNYFKDTVDTLGIQENEARRIIGNQEKLLSNFEERRTSISGVSMDEEMANLIQFQHAYGANAKIISTVDELLDVVVNGLKR
ncbi:flagellar basal body rod C-terminal domain-containing protein [Haloimpatiens lingqiaonensis]